MKILVAIIAGGRSSRFGGDKGAALLDGRALIDRVADGLRPQVAALVIVGRDWQGLSRIEDRPASDMGPLGGLCGALRYAAANGFDAVMTAGCDVLPVPIIAQCGIIDGHYLFGLWSASLAAALDHHLATQTNHSMRHWIAKSGAETIHAPHPFYNLNTRADFMLYEAQQGLAA